MTKAVTAFIGIGSNMGDRELALRQAVEAIGKWPGTQLLRASPVYETKPWGPTAQPDYLNMVVEISTQLDPHRLLRHCKDLEKRLGREASGERWGPRPLDLDVLLYGNRRLATANLVVPHPRMWERAFVLRPLFDLAPDLRAPGGVLIGDLLASERIAAQRVVPYEAQRHS